MKIQVKFESYVLPHGIRVDIDGTDAGKRAPAEVCAEIERRINSHIQLVAERDDLRQALEAALSHDQLRQTSGKEAAPWYDQARTILAKGETK